ncbi:TetR/AcrR family transcriptional regulator [Streptomyces roseicoloratus]|uniref:TetR/AcrR family transcriptional regulator n=1 Tax=Streptomyces roseicoloratus TaxID=2508722 RepID=A0ABY9S1J5_9ACTN|nr:TetR/AcrR family transcriptional regulator [Streptomyces roseicoloratus]WMX46950.1 TetR/AcrR family transcriptional regulator [Streptomyces roseicoloratus]
MSSSTDDAWTEPARSEVPPRKREKQMAMVRAACATFGREGYARASVDALAAAAGVSTRTLYNHFPGGKAQLFQTVVTWTSQQVRDAQLARLNALVDPERLPHPDALERDLVALARAFTDLIAAYPDHFALVRHLSAEADHVPAEVRAAWQDAGPAPVAAALTAAFTALADGGLLDLHGDAPLASGHFLALTSATVLQRSHYGVVPLPGAETERLLRGGVAAFLRAYGYRRTGGR